MKLAAIQFKASNNPEDNLNRVTELIKEVDNTDMIILPESFIFPFGTDFDLNTDYYINHFSNLAREKETIIVAGSLPEKDGDKVYNTSFVFGQDGKLLGKHRKVYLYDVNLEHLKTNESDRFNRGDSATVIETPFGKFGLLICYDLRFDHLFTECAKNGAHTILLPASFSNVTGPKHWETLLKARALDSQCFVLGCGAAQNDQVKFHPYGHSLFVSPDGAILDTLDGDEGILYINYNPEEVYKLREELPVLKQL